MRLNIDPNWYPNMLISLTEAVNNAIKHGNRFDDKKKILVSYRKKPHQILFIISDEGSGFDIGHRALRAITADYVSYR